MKKKKRIVFIQGAFDIINWGHIKAFQKAKSHGDYLIVALNSNRLVKEYKGRDAVLPWYQKAFIIRSCKFVDKVIEIDSFSPLDFLKKYKADVYCITREWQTTKDAEIEYMNSRRGKVVYIPRFKGGIPTSKIKEILLKEAKEGYTK